MILMDLDMPVMGMLVLWLVSCFCACVVSVCFLTVYCVADGFEATKRIIEMKCTSPIVCITAAATQDMTKQALAAGMVSVLTKPLEIDKVLGEFCHFPPFKQLLGM